MEKSIPEFISLSSEISIQVDPSPERIALPITAVKEVDYVDVSKIAGFDGPLSDAMVSAVLLFTAFKVVVTCYLYSWLVLNLPMSKY